MESTRSEHFGNRNHQLRFSNHQPPIPAQVQLAMDQFNEQLRRVAFPPRPQSETRTCLSSKQLGLTLCFMGFILLCTVAGKFIIEGPGVIDASRRPVSGVSTIGGSKRTLSFFFVSELIFLVFALGLFLTGVTCLRKRTNAYLLRQFRQHIINARNPEVSIENPGGESSRATTSSGTTLISMSEDEVGSTVENGAETALNFYETENMARYGTRRAGRSHRYFPDGLAPPGRNRRCYNYNYGCHQALLSNQKPPPYDVALYLPLPPSSRPISTEIDKDDKSSGLVEDNASTASSSGHETPPPAYGLQFSYDI